MKNDTVWKKFPDFVPEFKGDYLCYVNKVGIRIRTYNPSSEEFFMNDGRVDRKVLLWTSFPSLPQDFIPDQKKNKSNTD